MNLFATELLIDNRVRELRAEGPVLLGTTRIAAMLKRYEDDIASGGADPFDTGPVEQRRRTV
jgi:hypothetical protein